MGELVSEINDPSSIRDHFKCARCRARECRDCLADDDELSLHRRTNEPRRRIGRKIKARDSDRDRLARINNIGRTSALVTRHTAAVLCVLYFGRCTTSPFPTRMICSPKTRASLSRTCKRELLFKVVNPTPFKGRGKGTRVHSIPERLSECKVEDDPDSL